MIVPLFFGKDRDSTRSVRVRAMLANISRWNLQYDLVRRAIKGANPDILVLEEVHEALLVELADIRELYPYREECPRDDCFGIALWSRLPLEGAAITNLGTAGLPSVHAVARIEGKSVFVFGTHPLPPGGDEYWRHRNAQLDAIPGFLKRTDLPVIVLGDLNATPWCPYFVRLLRDSGLKDTQRGFGVQPTWPSRCPFLQIPLDHCLVSADFAVSNRKVGPYTGSDHYPLIVDLAL
jgi:endonuclease/exonuclease/phosphatase (EEP) superfamily protein YafD